MQVIQALPTDDPAAHHDLIERITSLAVDIKGAERAGKPLSEALRLRVIYHTAFAELLARTRATDAGAQADIEAREAKHKRLVASYRQELAQMEGEKGNV
ncbi:MULTISPECIES: hypothetical protein [unclassified Halomonas]|uniref:hypothetical protein n=1 Tax=unclassified Halomonas TaxID=2609666 RepID=UPI002887F1F3|nr:MULTISPECIES: hypothetical protein [unclassified Halomonas]MDT0499685.1 hypothetical protein [Halomonas sp. PAR7]MDT0510498.1 hypothetical protein [Halomonas sp. LES1]MDT0589793.1 hypothetical protein [Halomonas sp. PAR8]